jgi:ribosome-associated translation inhibitor RaiA
MILPVQISFRNLQPSKAVEERIQQETDKLNTFYDRITSCRVMVEAQHRHHKWGKPIHVRIELGVPGGELVVKSKPSMAGIPVRGTEEKTVKQMETDVAHKDIYVAIRDVFEAARRQLQEFARRQRGEVKQHRSRSLPSLKGG